MLPQASSSDESDAEMDGPRAKRPRRAPATDRRMPTRRSLRLPERREETSHSGDEQIGLPEHDSSGHANDEVFEQNDDRNETGGVSEHDSGDTHVTATVPERGGRRCGGRGRGGRGRGGRGRGGRGHGGRGRGGRGRGGHEHTIDESTDEQTDEHTDDGTDDTGEGNSNNNSTSGDNEHVTDTDNSNNSGDDEHVTDTVPVRGGRGRGGRGRGGRGRGGRGRGGRGGRGRGGRGRGGHGGAATSSSGPTLDTVTDNWQKQEPSSCTYPYTKTPGPTLPIPSDSTKLDLFYRFFTPEVWELLVIETNRYAAANLADPSNKPHARNWYDVTVDEIKAFIGLLILMGVLRLPRLEMYWQTSNPHIATIGISQVMTRIRFEQIYRFLHLANDDDRSNDPENRDKLFKVRQFANLLAANFQRNYVPHSTITIDEAMIPFKGRLSFKQYMKDKPTKWGIKVFVLSDATNGYVYRFQIYAGKSMDRTVEVGLCSRVVLELMSGLEDDGYDLYTDNYYTSPQLFLTLYNKGVNCCGTARVNRKGFPKALVKKEKKDRGYFDYLSNGPLLAVTWFDRKYVFFLSTTHRAETAVPCTIRRRNQDGSRLDVPCPPLLEDYQQFMRGVDRGDQLVGYYNIGRRSRKWWKRCFSYLVECSLLNAYVLDRDTCPGSHQRGRNKTDFLAFRLTIAKQLISGFSSRKRAGRPRSSDYDDLRRLNVELQHWPMRVEEKRNCIACTKIGTTRNLPREEWRHQTRVICSFCNVHLCLEKDRNCFMMHHTEIDYWN